jgi:pimeloyl-ACP methyl ester carboxylesterase
MATLLATRHPERFQAVVMHSGIPPGAAHSTLTALGAMHGHRTTVPLTALPRHMARHWPPLLVIHGDADITVSPHNAAAATATWAQAAGAGAGAGAGAVAGASTEAGAKAGVPRQVQRGKRHPMLVTDFTHQGKLVASLVQVAKLGHAWSGGAAGQPFSDALGPDASRMVWAFAVRQFRARAAAATQK